MSITKITEALSYPNGTPIEAIQGQITAVYERKDMGVGKYGPWSLQNAVLQDVGGNKIRVCVKSHPDITPFKGKEVVIHGKEGAIKVKHDKYTPGPGKKNEGVEQKTIELDVSKVAQFHSVEVYNQSKPESASPATPVSSPSTAVSQQTNTNIAGSHQNGVKPIFGATAGLGVNNARLECEAAGVDPTEQALWEKASKYVRVALKIERGDLHEPQQSDPF